MAFRVASRTALNASGRQRTIAYGTASSNEGLTRRREMAVPVGPGQVRPPDSRWPRHRPVAGPVRGSGYSRFGPKRRPSERVTAVCPILPPYADRTALDELRGAVAQFNPGASEATSPTPLSRHHGIGLRPAEFGHPVEDVTPDHGLSPLRVAVPRLQTVSGHGLVSKESVLDARLLAVARLLVPRSSPDLTNPLNSRFSLCPRAVRGTRGLGNNGTKTHAKG